MGFGRAEHRRVLVRAARVAGIIGSLAIAPLFFCPAAFRVLPVSQVSVDNPVVLVAVVDIGIDQRHEDLAGQVVNGTNLSDSPTASDILGHGTDIAGIIAATADNGIGIDGVAPDCRLLNVKVADDNGTFGLQH